MSDWQGTYEPPTGTITVAQIRAAINISETDQLSDAAIQSAIDRAISHITDLASRSGASAAIISLSKLNYAAFLAYLTYADRIVEQVPGAFDAQGVLQPVANPLAKQVVEKLRSLKLTSDESIEIISNTPISSSIGETPGPEDAENYPESLKLSNLDASW